MTGVWHDGTCGELRGALVDQLNNALEEIDAQIADLDRARKDVRTMRDGLGRMRATQSRVPGTTPCSCVRLLVAGD